MRVSKAELENLVLRLNKLTNSPTEYMTDGKINIGHYTLDWAYGGVQLQRVASDGGAVQTIISGFGTKKELYNKIAILISGTEYSKENHK